ncbi:MAG: alpha/beta hydrolase [Myxococcota bacterium]
MSWLLMASENANAAGKIDLHTAINVNGSKQWILMRGNNTSKPVVLFVHGGPGSPLTYFSRAFDGAFIDDFVVVHWDQRGAGKSFDAAESALNYRLPQYVDDGLVVVEHIREKLKKKKVLLVGHSWGTMVAFNMLAQRPKVFRSLVTVGTVSNMGEMERYRYQRVRAAVESSGDKEALHTLKN